MSHVESWSEEHFPLAKGNTNIHTVRRAHTYIERSLSLSRTEEHLLFNWWPSKCQEDQQWQKGAVRGSEKEKKARGVETSGEEPSKSLCWIIDPPSLSVHESIHDVYCCLSKMHEILEGLLYRWCMDYSSKYCLMIRLIPTGWYTMMLQVPAAE